MKSLLYYVFIAVAINFTAIAQNNKLKKAEQKFETFAFVDAIKIYEDVAEKGFENEDLYRKIGDAYYFNANYTDSAKWYKKLFALNTEQPIQYTFRYGQSLKSLGNYSEADKMLGNYYQQKGINYTSAEAFYKKENNANTKDKFVIDSLTSFNNTYSEYPGFVSNEGQLYVISPKGGDKIMPWTGQPTTDIFISNNNQIKALENSINSKYNEGSLVVTKDGETMYFTRNNFSGKKLGKDNTNTSKIKLYRATKNDDNQWDDVEELPFNSDGFSTGHPALNKTEDVLYFISDMPSTESKGGTDIYKVTINDDGTFGTPKNITTINTSGNEMFPFIAEDNTLYFASNGLLPNLGGLDVYKSTLKGNDYSQPENLGTPINSPFDDFSYYVDAEQKGYFGTNRVPDNNDDVFAFGPNEDYEEPCETPLKGIVKDKKSLEPIPFATVYVVDDNNTILKTVKADANAEFNFESVDCKIAKFLRAEHEDYITNEIEITEPYTQEYVILLDRRKVDLKEGEDLAIILNPIYFDFDKYNIRPDAAIELQKIVSILQQNSKLKISIGSHTDSRGNDAYNLRLSKNRAKSTMNYIIEQGIDSNRLTSNGYGETQLKNRCTNGVECSKAEHQLNRRSEFIILEK